MDTPVYLPVNERKERLHQVFAEFAENVHNLIDIVPEVSIFEVVPKLVILNIP